MQATSYLGISKNNRSVIEIPTVKSKAERSPSRSKSRNCRPTAGNRLSDLMNLDYNARMDMSCASCPMMRATGLLIITNRYSILKKCGEKSKH